MHTVSPTDFILPSIEDWIAGDSRTLAFQIVDANENPIDISGGTVEWSLFDRDYQSDASQAVLDGDSTGVEIVTDNRVDTSQGEFEIRLQPGATESLWGQFYQRPKVTQSDGTEASWLGEIQITA